MSYRAPAKETCHSCGKTVYAMEMMKADNLVFHKQCMKCTECQKTLSLGNYAALQGKYYCKPHFKQLFALKGNYSEGFGEEQHKMKWIKKDNEEGVPEPCAAAFAADDSKPAADDFEDDEPSKTCGEPQFGSPYLSRAKRPAQE